MDEIPVPQPFLADEERQGWEDDVRSRLEEMDIPWPGSFMRLSVERRPIAGRCEIATSVSLPDGIAEATTWKSQLGFRHETNHGLRLALIESMANHPVLQRANMVDIEFAPGGVFMWSGDDALYSHRETETWHGVLQAVEAFLFRRRDETP